MRKYSELFALLENNPAGVLLVAADGFLLAANSTAKSWLELTPNEGAEKPLFYSLVTEAYRDAVRGWITKVCAGEAGQSEFEVVGVKGRRRKLTFCANPWRDEEGKATGALLIMNETPERGAELAVESDTALVRKLKQRKQAERDLLMLGQAMNNAAEAIFLIDTELRFTFVNDAACRSLGYSREELLEMGPEDIDPTVTREQLVAMQQSLFANQYWGSVESKHRAKDGRIYPVEITASVFEHDGQKFGLAIVTDITERKRSQKLVQISEERLRLTLETLQIASWDWEVEQDRWFASPVYYTALGYEPRPGMGDRTEWLERVHPEDRPTVAKKIREVLTGGRKGVHL